MKFAAFEELETARLRLRKLDLGDLYEYYENLYGDGSVTKYMTFDAHQDIGESLESLQQAVERYDEPDFYRWAVERKEDEALIGVADLLSFEEETSTCSFAYMFAENCWNQGYATETMEALFRFAFEKLEVERIVADHMAANGASGAVMRKLGMTATGVIPGKYEKHGQVHDAVCYELARDVGPGLTVNEYQRLAMKTLNPGLSKKDVLINGVMGLCGESGEAIDIVKKHLHQGHPLDRERLVKELGDIAWYLAETAYALDIPLERVLQGNIDKLKERYPEGFSTENSVNRK